MEVYCVKEKKFTPNVPGSEKTEKTKNGRTLLKVKCASCGKTKTRFIPTQKGGAFYNEIVKLMPYGGKAMNTVAPFIANYFTERAKESSGYYARKREQAREAENDRIKEKLGLLRRQKPNFKAMSRAVLRALRPYEHIMHPITREQYRKALSSKGVS